MLTVNDILGRVPELLKQITGLPLKRAKSNGAADLALRIGSHNLFVEAKSNSRAGTVAQAAQIVREAAKRAGHHAIGLVAMPYMRDVRELLDIVSR